jgi:hypothetical protein
MFLLAGHWLTPVILATQEAEMRRIMFKAILVPRDPILKNPSQK